MVPHFPVSSSWPCQLVVEERNREDPPQHHHLDQECPLHQAGHVWPDDHWAPDPGCNDLNMGWQNWNLLCHPNAILMPQARQGRASGENLNYMTLVWYPGKIIAWLRVWVSLSSCLWLGWALTPSVRVSSLGSFTRLVLRVPGSAGAAGWLPSITLSSAWELVLRWRGVMKLQLVSHFASSE